MLPKWIKILVMHPLQYLALKDKVVLNPLAGYLARRAEKETRRHCLLGCGSLPAEERSPSAPNLIIVIITASACFHKAWIG